MDINRVKTPGIYVNEAPVTSASIPIVPTAIPAFVGYTSECPSELFMKAVLVESYATFQKLFGAPELTPILVNLSTTDRPTVSLPALSYFLSCSVRLFFANGGSRCYIISVGDTDTPIALGNDESGLQGGLKVLEAEPEPTLIVISDAVRLPAKEQYQTLVRMMLAQSANAPNRFAILDVYNGDTFTDDWGQGMKFIDAHRLDVENNHLRYGASYFPWLRISYMPVFSDTPVFVVALPDSDNQDATSVPVTPIVQSLDSYATSNPELYNQLKNELMATALTLPPSGAIAGVYASIDRNRGVWKAPANISLTGVLGPSVNVSDRQQNELTIHESGKSINVIRSFSGRGTLVWGARTLAGNDNEWRYVSVRRFCSMVEKSVKQSIETMVFEPNDANTWVKVRTMVENFLLVQWRQGALQGAKPEHAFYVRVGLGQTMTSLDLLEGRMNIDIGLAIIRPAEFIVLRIRQKVAES